MTEREILLSWRELFRGKSIDESVYVKAAQLIDALPATSPLRQRYAQELADLRRLQAPTVQPNSKTAKSRRVK